MFPAPHWSIQKFFSHNLTWYWQTNKTSSKQATKQESKNTLINTGIEHHWSKCLTCNKLLFFFSFFLPSPLFLSSSEYRSIISTQVLSKLNLLMSTLKEEEEEDYLHSWFSHNNMIKVVVTWTMYWSCEILHIL